MSPDTPDIEPVETQRVARLGRRRRRGRRSRPDAYLLDRVVDHAQDLGVPTTPGSRPRTSTPSRPRTSRASGRPGARALATALVRWNAIAIVLQANRSRPSSAATSRATSRRRPLRDRLQPFLAARRTTTAATSSTSRGTRRRASTRARSSRGASPRSSCANFRQEVGRGGLSSYPHPWLMPEFWQFPTVSMGLGPLMAIYQARS